MSIKEYLNKISPSNTIFIIGACLFMTLYYSESGRYFWLDEITSFDIVNSHSVIEIPKKSMQIETQPPLFHLTGKLFTSWSSNPKILRLITGISFFGCFYLYFQLFKNNWFSFLICFLYLCFNTKTEYFLTEFRPYTFSAFILLLFIYGVVTWRGARKYLVCSLLLLLFSLTLSINAPYVVLGYLWLGFLLWQENFFIKRKIAIAVYFICALLSFSNFILLVLSNTRPQKTPFSYEKFYAALLENWGIVLKSFLIDQPAFLVLIIMVALYRLYASPCKIEKQVVVFSLIIISSMTICTTFLFYNRINWYGFRYSYLVYFFIPFLIFPLKNSLPDNELRQRSHYNCTLLFFLLVVFVLRYDKMNFRMENHERSPVFKSFIENVTLCNDLPVYVLSKPRYIDRELKFHVYPRVPFAIILHEKEVKKLKDLCLLVFHKKNIDMKSLFSDLGVALDSKSKEIKYYNENKHGPKGFHTFTSKFQ